MKKKNLPQLFPAAVAAVVLFSSGCASTYRFQVEAVKNNQPIALARSFRVESANPEMDEADLRFQEVVEYVKTALSSKGFYEAPPGVEPEMIVAVDFGLEGPQQEIRTYFVPVASSSRESFGAQRSPAANALVSPGRAPGNMFLGENADDGMMEEQVSFVVTVYDKFLHLSAREAPTSEADRVQREIWSVLVSNRDESDDLRKYAPLLVTAAMDHVDENLAEPEDVVLTDTDARVGFVVGGL